MGGLWHWRGRNRDEQSREAIRRAQVRRRAHRRGYLAEFAALLFLMTKGYRPLAWRFSASGGEIDLIVRRGDVIAFVEVKARKSIEDAIFAIDGRKRQRFSRAMNAWLIRNPWGCERSLRIDAVYITGWLRPHHYEGAFEPGRMSF